MSSAASSVACVHEGVSRHFAVPVNSSIHALHFCVKGPSPQIFWFSTACLIYSISRPVNGGTLKLIIETTKPFHYFHYFSLYFTLLI